ncbi:MAG: hypothetical protein PUD81_03835, partial [Eggerthellales bacterium]|nr:hypothetical protein [Eggerthellales bacterium]
GLVYFTDGWGDYPEWMPDYKVAFVFYDESYRPEIVPTWAAQIVLDENSWSSAKRRSKHYFEGRAPRPSINLSAIHRRRRAWRHDKKDHPDFRTEPYQTRWQPASGESSYQYEARQADCTARLSDIL